MEEKDLKKVLEEYLQALKLPTFIKNYQAFAQDAARSGQSYERFLKVRFFSAAALVNDLLAAQHNLQLSKFKAPLLRSDLIVLDEVGFIPFTTEGAQSLFQFCSDVNERVSIIVTTNLRFGDWISIFGNETMTTALLDRLTGKGHILEFVGESYRFRQRLRQEELEGLEGKTETG